MRDIEEDDVAAEPIGTVLPLAEDNNAVELGA